MSWIRYALICDGSSDRMLMPILDWLLHHHCPNYSVESQWADLGRLPQPPRKLSEKIRLTVDLYRPDLVFIHRDAEKQAFELRRSQIKSALSGQTATPAVCIIPVRMQEAWLLFNEEAIRKAAGNPNGRIPLRLPDFSAVEALPDPKCILFSLISDASGLRGTRLKKLKPQQRAHLVSQFIGDFNPLRHLSAFRALEEELLEVVQEMGWDM